MCAEEIVSLRRVFPSLRSVDGHPAVLTQVKFRPAVITADLAAGRPGRQGKSDFKFRGNPRRASQSDKQSMKICAISTLGITGPINVSVTPARAGFVVLHVCQ